MNVIFTRKLVCTPMGRLASRILAQWTIEFPDLPAPSTVDRPESPDVIVAKVVQPTIITNSTIGLIKKVKNCDVEENTDNKTSDSRESTATTGIKRKALDILPVKKMKKVCSSGKGVEIIYHEFFSSTKCQTKLTTGKPKKSVMVLRPSETQKKKEIRNKSENKKKQGKTLKIASTR